MATDRPVTVIAAHGPPALAAQVLVDAAGWILNEVAESPLEWACAVLARGDSDVTVLALAGEVGDAALLDVLDIERRWMDSDTPWSCVPSFTLIIGRDHGDLARVVDKVVAGHARPPATSLRLRWFVASGATLDLLELDLGGNVVRRQALGGDELENALREPVDVLAIETHGTESCAKADGGVVFCGRLPHVKSRLGQRALACGFGNPCPKGDRPFPLRGLDARAVVLASCSSLRLGDAALEHDFNLGLSCLDGPAEVYVGSVFPSGGSRAAAQVILAVLATGGTVAEGTCLANALLRTGRLDFGGRVGVGAPDLRLGTGGIVEAHGRRADAGALAYAFGAARAGAVRISDPAIIDRAIGGRLVLRIDAAEPGISTVWFGRVEASDAGRCLRVFLFRFPEALGDLTIRFADIDDVEGDVQASFERLRVWWRYHQMVRASSDGGDVPEFADAARVEIDRAVTGLRSDGSALAEVERLRAVVEEAGRALRQSATATLVEQLGRAFWLPNVLAPTQQLMSSTVVTCRYCAGVAVQEVFNDRLIGAERKVVVCARCSIVSDLTTEGPVLDIELAGPAMVSAPCRVDIDVRLRLHRAAAGAELRLWPRLSTPGFDAILSSPEHAVLTSGALDELEARFHFELTADVLPHYYTVKVLIASDDHLAFGARRLMVSTTAR